MSPVVCDLRGEDAEPGAACRGGRRSAGGRGPTRQQHEAEARGIRTQERAGAAGWGLGEKRARGGGWKGGAASHGAASPHPGIGAP